MRKSRAHIELNWLSVSITNMAKIFQIAARQRVTLISIAVICMAVIELFYLCLGIVA